MVRTLADLADTYGVFPVVVSVGNCDAPAHIMAAAREGGVPLVRGIDRAMRAISGIGASWAAVDSVPAVEHTVAQPRLVGAGALPEFDSATVLRRYGVVVAEGIRAENAQAAAAAADSLGYPVVVKVDGPAHKSRSNGVILGLTSPHAVSEAATAIGGPVLVARQLPPGIEVYCGMNRDPAFGPVFTVGFGGTDVEARTPAVALGPVDRELATGLVRSAGLPPSASGLVDVLLALGRLASEHPEVTEIDVNPLIVTTEGVVAVDALVVLEQGVSR
ncbi:acetate--CoA ligase family protein [Nocardioides mesophilus]|uniref:acetate--CoA ligase family protein n=1 Tax=Nocardioides mesophilus TaxID=433659 RepID=UPI001FE452C5|nr:acetate--CoA ligase family protein [Nocardioides mesophilus]